jgi:hypothetical protein
MTTEQGKSRAGEGLRATVGVVLFVVWAVLTFLWFYDAIHALIHGEPGPAIKAVVWLLLMLLLAGMEGLEVAVIDRWSHLYPERSTSDLAAWLAARQLFVALIVTGATLLADRDSLAIPFVATPFTGGVALKIFNLVFTTLTVLWFMQIFPKHMAATNADRYLKVFQSALFPVVEFVRVIGISWPAEKTAQAVQNRLDWHAESGVEEEAVARRGGGSLAQGWAALVPERAPATRRSSSDDRAAGPTGS